MKFRYVQKAIIAVFHVKYRSPIRFCHTTSRILQITKLHSM